MLKFYTLLKVKIIISAIIILNYSLWCYFFILQGNAIDLAIKKNDLALQVLYALIGFVVIKMLAMLCDVFQRFFTEYYKNIEMKHQWHQLMPKHIYRENKNQDNELGILFFDYLPRLFDFEINMTKNAVTLLYIAALTTAAFLYSRFYMGALALLLVFLLNYVSKNIFTKALDQHQTDANNSKLAILKWLSQYFLAYREISKNWPGVLGSSWINDIYSNHYTAKNNLTFYYLYRNLLSQVLVELPFLLNSSVVIMGVYYGHLSLSHLFVWIGFSQFMISASNAFLENRVSIKQRDSLAALSQDILSKFRPRESAYDQHDYRQKRVGAVFKLKDGTENTLSLEPGIYPIKGANGSGKSTLLDIILHYEHQYDDFEHSNIQQFKRLINNDDVRVIERDAVLFDCISDINCQICGPIDGSRYQWHLQAAKAMHYLLGPTLSNQWMMIFKQLETAYDARKSKTLSSGQRVMLSTLRFLCSWHKNVNLLVIDECDSFLDSQKKCLFIHTIHALSSQMAVYICSHDAIFSDPRVNKLNAEPAILAITNN